MDDNLVNIANLLKRENQLKEDLSKVRNAIRILQDLCSHRWSYEGCDGGGKRWKRCKVCNETDWD